MSTATPPPAAGAGSAGLDWRDSSHWSTTLLPCVHCAARTNLRDDDGRPSHKTCAEAVADPAGTGVDAPGGVGDPTEAAA